MAFIKEESEDEWFGEGFGVKQEDTEVQTDLMILKEEKSEAEEKHHVLMTVEKSVKTEESPSQTSPQTSDSDSNFSCGQCGKRFNSKQNLDVHMSVHTGEEPSVCDQCGKWFTCEENLKCHTCIQSVKNGYRCNHCGKSFSHKANSIRHLQIHVKEKSFMCPVCGKSFSKLENLEVHMNVHTGEEPYVCDQCGKRFTCEENLKCHTCIHSVKNGYRCGHCKKCFRLKGTAVRHLQTHVKEKSFTCSACGKSFSKHRNLEVHMRIHEEITTESGGNGLVDCSQDSELATPAWQENVEDEMIRLVQERPALYDAMVKGYGNRVVKAQLWCEIENELDLSSIYLRKKWNCLRAQFVRLKKLQYSGRFETVKTGRQQWILERLQFLKPHIKLI